MANLFHLLFVLVVTKGNAASIPSADDILKLNYENLADAERRDFLTFLLAKGLLEPENNTAPSTFDEEQQINLPENLGIHENLIRNFQDMDIPKSSIDNYLLWTEEKFNLTKSQIKQILIRSILAKKFGLTFPDVNELCCPWM